jgi:hypothetical protein
MGLRPYVGPKPYMRSVNWIDRVCMVLVRFSSGGSAQASRAALVQRIMQWPHKLPYTEIHVILTGIPRLRPGDVHSYIY